MKERLNLEPLEALAEKMQREAARTAEPSVSGRRSFLTRAALGAAALPVGLLASQARGQEAAPPVTPQVAQAFRDIQQHENDHVDALLGVLGSAARPKPTFKNLVTRSLDQFLFLAQTFENVGVGAYLNATPAIAEPGIVGAAGQIALIEARHAGFLNFYLGDPITMNVFGQERSFELGLSAAQVRSLTRNYIQSLNGGPPLFYSDQNDRQILNFALALEFLEQEFYNINVPFYFGTGPEPG